MDELHVVHAQARLPQSDSQVLAIDIQMKLVADQENAYWSKQFFNEHYYIAGRGYDQYQPAYALGWRTALEYPDARFGDLAAHLERQWSVRRATSLLPWREVHDAVKIAWEHANSQMKEMQYCGASKVFHGVAVGSVLQPLCKSCRSLRGELLRMRAVPMHDFARQVLDRHVRLLLVLAQELEACFAEEVAHSAVIEQSIWRVRAHWRKIRMHLIELSPIEVFEIAANRERLLLELYQGALMHYLPEDVQEVLSQQQKKLKKECEKLVWVRQNWSLS